MPWSCARGETPAISRDGAGHGRKHGAITIAWNANRTRFERPRQRGREAILDTHRNMIIWSKLHWIAAAAIVCSTMDRANGQFDSELRRLPAITGSEQIRIAESFPRVNGDEGTAVPAESSETVATPIAEDIPAGPPIGPTWYDPSNWVKPEIWDGSFEVGMNGSAGNAESMSSRIGSNLTRETNRTKTELESTYARTKANSLETQHNALLRGQVDWKSEKSRWSPFARFGLEYDEFKDFDIRLTSNGGLRYKLVETEATTFGSRVGAGISREFGGTDDDVVPEATFGFDLERQLTERQKLKAEIDYFPAWDRFSDFRMVSDIAWEILLDKESNLHLKILAIDRYDSTPNGVKKNDIDYSLLLMWKL